MLKTADWPFTYTMKITNDVEIKHCANVNTYWKIRVMYEYVHIH